jgi:peptide deformylase
LAVLDIRTFGDPVLRTPAKEVEKVTDMHRRLIADMVDTMRAAPGVGLAGPQIGVMERIFVWETEEEHGAVINPRIVDRADETVIEEEGCLSLPGLAYPVERSVRVSIEGLDANGDPIELTVEDFKARIFQHEIDHLDGVLFIDRITPEERKEALTMLREQALGLPVTVKKVPEDERL